MKTLVLSVLLLIVFYSVSFAMELSCRTTDHGKHFIFNDHGKESMWTMQAIDRQLSLYPKSDRYISMKILAQTILIDQRKNHNGGNFNGRTSQGE